MNIRKHLPYENFTLTSLLSAEAIMNRLGDVVGPERSRLFYWFNSVDMPYEGDLRNTTFKISKIDFNNRQDCNPVISGSITTLTDKTAIDIKMRPPFSMKIFMTIWLGSVGFICLVLIYIGVTNFPDVLTHGFNPALIIPFIVFALGYAIAVYKFKLGCRKGKEFLEDLMEARENLKMLK